MIGYMPDKHARSALRFYSPSATASNTDFIIIFIIPT